MDAKLDEVWNKSLIHIKKKKKMLDHILNKMNLAGT